MSGRTGKMTQDEIDARGPRFVLARNLENGALFYYREDANPFKVRHAVVAKSYSMSYLQKVAKHNA